MTDYYCQLYGQFPNGRKWSTARHITSSQLPAEMLTTWTNAITAAWNDGANGFKLVYPVATTTQRVTVATLGPTMRETAKLEAALVLPGVNTNASLPVSNSIVFSWSSSTRIGRTARGNQKFPAPAENEAVNDKLVGDTQTALKAAITMIKTAIQSDGSQFFVYPDSDTSTGIPAYTKQTIDTVACRDVLGTIRKRIKKEPATYV